MQIKRILLNKMQLQDGLYFYNGELFNGIGFELKSNDVVKSCEFKNGLVSAPYISICDDGSDNLLHVNLSEQMWSEETTPFTYLGERFENGIAYSFEGDICDAEFVIKNGLIQTRAMWDHGDLLSSYDTSCDDFGASYEWYPNGLLKSCNISTNKSFYGHFGFRDNGSLWYFDATRGFLKKIEYLYNKVKFFPISKLLELSKFKGDRKFVLTGDDINKSFFDFMFGSNLLQNTEKLSLIRIDLNSLHTSYLNKMENLSEIIIVENDPEKIKFAQNIKYNMPHIRVQFGRTGSKRYSTEIKSY